MIENSITHNLMNRRLDTQGYTIFVTFLSTNGIKIERNLVRGRGWVLGVSETHNVY
jgi:paraquat-inducible protein B